MKPFEGIRYPLRKMDYKTYRLYSGVDRFLATQSRSVTDRSSSLYNGLSLRASRSFFWILLCKIRIKIDLGCVYG